MPVKNGKQRTGPGLATSQSSGFRISWLLLAFLFLLALVAIALPGHAKGLVWSRIAR
jgi:hypothetical protein